MKKLSDNSPARPFIGIPYGRLIAPKATTYDNVRVLFDAAGFISGVQLYIPKALMSTALKANTMVLKDTTTGDGYVTVYLVFPTSKMPRMAHGVVCRPPCSR